MAWLSETASDWTRLKEVDSTNRYLLAGDFPSGSVVIADHQHSGRGRKGRQWGDRPGGALLFSGRLEFDLTNPVHRERSYGLLPLATGLALVQFARDQIVLREQSGQPAVVSLKWPNDLFITRGAQTGKAGGILIESETRGSRMVVVIGIGLNLAGELPLVEVRPFMPTTLFEALAEAVSAAELLPELIARLNLALPLIDRPDQLIEMIRGISFLDHRMVQYRGKVFEVLGVAASGGILLRPLPMGAPIEITETSEEIIVL